MYTEVKNDLFDLSRRLKKINRDYCIYLNNRNSRYEVHCGKTANNKTLAFIVPYERLDSRIIEYANKTRKQNDVQIEREINNANEQVRREIFDNLSDKQKELEDMLAYASGTNQKIDFTKNFIKEF